MKLKLVPPPPWAGDFRKVLWAIDTDGRHYYRSESGQWILARALAK